MQKTLIKLMFLSSLLLSCAANKDLAQYEIDVDKKSEMGSLFKSYSYVMLENTEKAILSDIKKLNVDDKYISVSQKNEVVLFDKSGNFVSKINAHGLGHGEYVSLDDYAIQEDCVYILSRAQKTINVYNLKGNFVKELKLKDWYSHLVFCGKDTLLLSSENANMSKKNFLVYNAANGKNIKTFDPFDRNENLILGNYTPFCGKSERGFYVTHPFDHDIYEIDSKGIKPYLNISFTGKGKLPANAKSMSYSQLLEATTHKSVVQSLGLFCKFNDCFYITFDMFSNNGGLGTYVCRFDMNGNSKTVCIGENFSNDFPYTTSPMAVYKDNLVSICPADIVLRIEKYYNLNKFTKLGLTKESNYVVFFNKLRH